MLTLFWTITSNQKQNHHSDAWPKISYNESNPIERVRDKEQKRARTRKATWIQSDSISFPQHPHEDSSFWQECSWQKKKNNNQVTGRFFFNEKKAAPHADY